jgi:hypothetical protein
MDAYSKDFLQNYARDKEADSAAKMIIQEVLRCATRGKTQHVVRVQEYAHGAQDMYGGVTYGISVTQSGVPNHVTNRLVYFLKQSFPDSVVEYREATSLAGRIERGIVIDWS